MKFEGKSVGRTTDPVEQKDRMLQSAGLFIWILKP